MEVKCKTTTELSLNEIESINSLYKEVFHIARSTTEFFEIYQNTPFGYSYHSILYDDNGVVSGFHSCMPFYYLDGDKKFSLGLGINSMVEKKHRDFFNFSDMIRACEKRLKQDGFSLRIGFPNDNSYPVLKKGLKYKDIGKLTTYCLVRKLGGVKPNLKLFNPFSKLFAHIQILCSYFIRDKKTYNFRFCKERGSFNDVRYKWFNRDYKIFKSEKVEFSYRVMNYHGVETAFLLDVHPMSRYNFEYVVREIYKSERRNIDIILYVGHLPFTPVSLIRIPHKYEPKHFNFTCNPLDKNRFDKSLFDINNWNVNLSNYDLL